MSTAIVIFWGVVVLLTIGDVATYGIALFKFHFRGGWEYVFIPGGGYVALYRAFKLRGSKNT